MNIFVSFFFLGRAPGVPLLGQALGWLHLLLHLPKAHLATLLYGILIRLQKVMQVRQGSRRSGGGSSDGISGAGECGYLRYYVKVLYCQYQLFSKSSLGLCGAPSNGGRPGPLQAAAGRGGPSSGRRRGAQGGAGRGGCGGCGGRGGRRNSNGVSGGGQGVRPGGACGGGAERQMKKEMCVLHANPLANTMESIVSYHMAVL